MSTPSPYDLETLLDQMTEDIKKTDPGTSDFVAAMGAVHTSRYALIENLTETVQQGEGLGAMELFLLVSAMIVESNWMATKILALDIKPEDAGL